MKRTPTVRPASKARENLRPYLGCAPSDMAATLTLLEAMLSKTATRSFKVPLQPSTLADLIRAFEASDEWARLSEHARRQVGHALRRLEAAFGARIVDSITVAEATQFYAQANEQGGGPRLHSSAVTIRTARRVCNFGISKRMCRSNPFSGVRLRSGSDVVRPSVDAAAVAALIAEADRAGHAGIGTAIALAYELGLRPDEALALTQADFDRDCHAMARGETTFLVSPQLRRRISAALATAADVVARPNGKPWRDACRVFFKTFRRICRAAGVSDAVTLWDVRRSGLMVESGRTPPAVGARRRLR